MFHEHLLYTSMRKKSTQTMIAFYCCDKTVTKGNSGTRGVIRLLLPHYSPSSREGGGDLEALTEAEIMEGCCFLACSPWLAQPVVLYLPGPLV